MLSAAQPADVVREADHHQEEDEGDADRRDALEDLAGDRFAADRLDHREGDVAAVEREQRKHVHQRQRETDEAEDPEVLLGALIGALRELLRDADRARDVLPPLTVDEAAERFADLARDDSRELHGPPRGLAEPELLTPQDEAE